MFKENFKVHLNSSLRQYSSLARKKDRTMGGAENTSQLVMKRRSWIDVLTHVTHLYEKKLIAHRNMNDYSSFAW